ncbi:polysaccharide biosynthesis/export family protein [Vampirovibrio sp.]|uniref:polysaccharide biosynthesis/export family protein n=1 Tax=Vampirovibrio sp. TaxID=2717857 RepID=UPI0035938483
MSNYTVYLSKIIQGSLLAAITIFSNGTSLGYAEEALKPVDLPVGVGSYESPLDKPADSPLLPAGEPSAESAASKQLSAQIVANFTGRKYRLGPNDILTISVYDAPEFSQENLLVQPDGNITLAPFGAIDVAGTTIDDLQKDVSQRLKYYLNDPKVTVKLERTKPFQVYVTGGVLRPGAYEMVTDISRVQMVSSSGSPGVLMERKLPLLSNVLVAAGGLKYDADLEHVRVRNRFDGSSFEINVLDLIQNGNTEQDLFLIAGDSVEVPSLPTPYALDDQKYKAMLGSSVFQKDIPVKVYGYVNKPGLYLLDGAQSANLNSAIGQAGGYLATEASYSPTKVYVSRVDGDGHLTTTTVDPRHDDLALRPNDIVYVPNKVVPRVGKAFDYMTRVVMPFASLAAGMNNWALLFDPTRFNVNLNTR